MQRSHKKGQNMHFLPQSFFSVPQLAVVVFSMLRLLSVPLLKMLAKDNKKNIQHYIKTNKQNKIIQEQNQY